MAVRNSLLERSGLFAHHPAVWRHPQRSLSLASATRRRNQFFGPGYFDTDFTVMKYTGIPHWEGAKLGIGAQFFNILNHPNFDQPVRDISNWLGPVRPDPEDGQHSNQHSGIIPRRRRCPALDPVDGKA
jgi:hypothetical protein